MQNLKKQETKHNAKQKKTQVNKLKKPLGFYIPLLSWSPLMEVLP
jgi:hypothetical protein